MGCCEGTLVLNDIACEVGANQEHQIQDVSAAGKWGGGFSPLLSASETAPGRAPPQAHRPPGVPYAQSPRRLRKPIVGPAAFRLVSYPVPELVRLQYREVTPEDYDLLCVLDDDLPRRGTLAKAGVDGLPRTPACQLEATTCQICLSDFQPHLRVIRLPCSHAFHPECISKWLTEVKGTCPVCAAPVKRGAGAEIAPDPQRPGPTGLCRAAAKSRG